MAAAATPSPDVFKLGFVGAGNMAESIARGVAKSAVLPPSSIRTAASRADRRAVFDSFGIHVFDTNAQVVDDSDVVVISVKPQIVKPVLLELKPFFSEEKVLVSVAAGIRMKDLQEWSGQQRVIRVMPNTPSAVGQAASGLSGSGPAFIYLAIEALADGGVAAGLPRDLAIGLASQTVLGAAAMVKHAGKHPGQLKDEVSSPAGTTIAGIQELEKGAFRGTLMSAVLAATKRSQELS